MITSAESGIQSVYKHWLNAATTLLACQWKLFEAQYQIGLEIMETAIGGAAPSEDARATRWPGRSGRDDLSADKVKEAVSSPVTLSPPLPVTLSSSVPLADAVAKLEQRAAERISLGLAPPKEIYQTPYRSQIHWDRFPRWAWPNDPELFDGSGHEG